jgi:hypothetical protein
MHENGKMRPVETVLRKGEGAIKEKDRMNLTKIYCKYFCILLNNIPQCDNNMIINKNLNILRQMKREIQQNKTYRI